MFFPDAQSSSLLVLTWLHLFFGLTSSAAVDKLTSPSLSSSNDSALALHSLHERGLASDIYQRGFDNYVRLLDFHVDQDVVPTTLGAMKNEGWEVRPNTWDPHGAQINGRVNKILSFVGGTRTYAYYRERIQHPGVDLFDRQHESFRPPVTVDGLYGPQEGYIIVNAESSRSLDWSTAVFTMYSEACRRYAQAKGNSKNYFEASFHRLTNIVVLPQEGSSARKLAEDLVKEKGKPRLRRTVKPSEDIFFLLLGTSVGSNVARLLGTHRKALGPKGISAIEVVRYSLEAEPCLVFHLLGKESFPAASRAAPPNPRLPKSS